jgi:hypothetical protein
MNATKYNSVPAEYDCEPPPQALRSMPLFVERTADAQAKTPISMDDARAERWFSEMAIGKIDPLFMAILKITDSPEFVRFDADTPVYRHNCLL